MNYQDLLNHFDRVTESGGQYRANCPACGDTKQHLYIKESEGKILLDCKKGCSFKDIIYAAGLKEEDCFPEKQPKTPWTLLREHIYTDEKGVNLAKKQIYDKGDGGKTAIWYRIEKGQYAKGLNNLKMPLYHLNKLVSAASDTVIVVEGEKDVETCERMGFAATTSPNGASAKWSRSYTPYFKNKNVCIITDNDEPGENFGQAVAAALMKTAAKIKLIPSAEIYPQLKAKGDISDIAEEVGLNETKRLLTEAVKRTADYVPSAVKQSEGQKKGGVPDFIYGSVNDKTGEVSYRVSCPLLAAHFRKNEHYFWLRSEGGKPLRYLYRDGIYVRVSDDEIKGVIKKYITDFMNTILKMRDVDEVFKNLCSDPVFHSVEELNADENIINFRNGILKLDTMELVPHSPDYLCTVQIACDWNLKNTEAPVFDRYINTLTGGNEEIKRLLLQFIGAVISNVYGYRMKSALFMVGAGNTGKSQLKALVEKLIGAVNCSPCSLKDLEERFGTSLLYGKRLIGSSDMSFMTVKELKTFKNITGGDHVNVEYKGRDSFQYIYKGLVWFCTNQLPKFGGDRGEHVYDRIIVVRCNNVVPPEQRDSRICDKMYEERESIVAQAVCAFRELDGKPFTVPEICKTEKEAYKVENSPVLSFYNECCTERVVSVDKCTCAVMYRIFREWCRDNNFFTPNKSVFRQELSMLAGGDITELEKTVKGQRYYTFTLNRETKEQYAYMYGFDI